MNFFKKLFGSSVSPSEEEQKEAEGKEFDVLKYDGMRFQNRRNGICH